MNNYLIYGGLQSDSYGVNISGEGTYDAPERQADVIQIPGRNGDLVIDRGRYNNIQITYPAFITESFASRFDTFRAAMLNKTGYNRLEDTYHPDEYRMATLTGAITADTGAYNKIGSFKLVFNCQPQRWLKSGETETTLTSSGTITNPTAYASKPLLKVYGYGNLGIGSMTITIASPGYSYLYIDCEAMDAYNGATPLNHKITLSGNEFPELAPGPNSISLGSGITKVLITPRWWTI